MVRGADATSRAFRLQADAKKGSDNLTQPSVPVNYFTIAIRVSSLTTARHECPMRMSELDKRPVISTAGLPEPSAELVLIRVLMASYLATASPKRGAALLREASRLLESEEAIASVFPIRPGSHHAAMGAARRRAVMAFRLMMPTFVASLPPESI